MLSRPLRLLELCQRAVLTLSIAFVLGLVPCTDSIAQPTRPGQTHPGQEATAPLPTLDVVLAAARTYSPRLRMEVAAITSATAAVRGTRALWLQGITVGASTNYGSTGSALLDEVTLGTQTTVGVRLSLYDLFGRRYDVRAQEARVTQAREQEALVRIEEDRFVTQLYHQTVLAERLVGVRSEALQAARSHYAVAERAFTQGHLSVADLAQVTQTKASAEATYESASADYRNAYAQLELTVGASLRALADEPLAVGDSTPDSDAAPDGTAPPDNTAAPDGTAAPIQDDR